MTTPAERVAVEALQRMSEAFFAQDRAALLESFSAHPSATYAGSEAGETAAGPEALHRLFTEVLARPDRYSFTFSEVRAHAVTDAVWVLADGTGVETSPAGVAEPFPYRVSGVLVREAGAWRWALLTGSEPTHAPTDGCGAE
jgi:hypothetical protein